jgi:hypothetical protein
MLVGFLEANFDISVRNSFSVATTVISDDNGKIIAACTKRLNSTEVNYSEGQAAFW